MKPSTKSLKIASGARRLETSGCLVASKASIIFMTAIAQAASRSIAEHRTARQVGGGVLCREDKLLDLARIIPHEFHIKWTEKMWVGFQEDS